MEQDIAKIKSTLKKLLKALEFEADLVVKKRSEAYFVDIETDQPAIMIGKDGEILQAFQHIFRILLDKELEIYVPVVLDVNGYRAKRLIAIEKEAKQAIRQVRETKRSVTMPAMNSYERRAVHTLVSNSADVESQSEGFGEERRVVIRIKNR